MSERTRLPRLRRAPRTAETGPSKGIDLAGVRRYRDDLVARAHTALDTRPDRVARMLAIALAAVVVLAGAAWGGWQYCVNSSTAAGDAISAANSAIPQVLSYDPPSIDGQVSSTKTLLTGQFKSDYAHLIQTVVGPGAKAQQIGVQTAVAKDGVVSASPNQVVLLMFINRTIERPGDDDPALSSDRIQVTMQHQDGQWLISQVDPV